MVWFIVALIAAVGVFLALILAVAYYRGQVNTAAAAADVADDRVAGAEQDRVLRDQERYRAAQETAKNATISTATALWNRARDRVR